jgi:hypothetical protein
MNRLWKILTSTTLLLRPIASECSALIFESSMTRGLKKAEIGFCKFWGACIPARAIETPNTNQIKLIFQQAGTQDRGKNSQLPKLILNTNGDKNEILLRFSRTRAMKVKSGRYDAGASRRLMGIPTKSKRLQLWRLKDRYGK